MSTQSVIVRLPSKMVDSIDLLVNDGLFASRAGFVDCAIYYRLPKFMEEMYNGSWGMVIVDLSIRPQTLKERVNQMFEYERRHYSSFSGEPIRINVRVSDGILNLWNSLKDIADGLFPFQDFVRYSVASYLFLWSEAMSNVNLVKKNMKLKLSKEAEQSVKDAINDKIYYVCSGPDSHNPDDDSDNKKD
ncbi:MAG: hypothetical protein PWR17_1159 [Candidatus Methanomethylophilaceae archaeon]|nr:hypothetical protein [Candidatus Methanomethylophilaceae archaeon]